MGSPYHRILLKLSGEVLAGSEGFGISPGAIGSLAKEVCAVHALDLQVGIVIGGGNVIRGVRASAEGMDRANADYMGMLASVINALALQDSLEKLGLITRIQTALEFKSVAEPYIRRRAIRHLDKGRVVIFAAGTGNPYFSTDTAAALRAAEIHADVVLKATKVDGVYNVDPSNDKNAVRYEDITFEEAIRSNLQFMDQAAIALCRENGLPIVVFNMTVPGNIRRVAAGDNIGTTVHQ